jgi:hypothetical protein
MCKHREAWLVTHQDCSTTVVREADVAQRFEAAGHTVERMGVVPRMDEIIRPVRAMSSAPRPAIMNRLDPFGLDRE